MGIIYYLLKNAKRFPDKTAVIFSDISLSYSDFVEKIRRLSASLDKVGVKEGSHIGLLLNNSIEFAITIFAAADLGAVIVPMPNTLGDSDLLTAIEITDIDFLIAWHVTLKGVFSRLQDRFPLSRQHCICVGGGISGCHVFNEMLNMDTRDYELGQRVINDEADFILTMTSGSTNVPKPIVLSQGTKIRRSLGAQELYSVSEDDITLVTTPMYHSLAQRLVLMPIITGGTCVIMSKFTPDIWSAIVRKHKVTFTIMVSSQLEMISRNLNRKDYDLSSLRCIVSCCALLKDDINLHLMKGTKISFHECYGASEVGIVSNLAPEDTIRSISTVGKPVSGVQIMIVDGERKPVGIGEIGEIICKTPMRFSRYYKNERATRESMVDGFFCTGDMGYLNEDGYLVFCGRKKEIIITGGINVYPADVEVVLNRHPRVKESAVIGVEDERLGEAVLAVVVSREGESPLTSRELQRYCLSRLADFQRPMAYEFVDALPRNEMGKPIRYKLKDRFRGYDATEGLRRIMNK